MFWDHFHFSYIHYIMRFVIMFFGIYFFFLIIPFLSIEWCNLHNTFIKRKNAIDALYLFNMTSFIVLFFSWYSENVLKIVFMELFMFIFTFGIYQYNTFLTWVESLILFSGHWEYCVLHVLSMLCFYHLILSMNVSRWISVFLPRRWIGT
jgi:hypothetical protein